MKYQSLDAFLAALPGLAAPHQDKLRGHDALFQVETREGRLALIRLRDGRVSVETAAREKPDCTLRADEQTLMGLINGQQNPVKCLALGKIRVSGDMGRLWALLRLL